MKNHNHLKEAIYILNEVYNVPYDVLAYCFGISRITVYHLKKKAKRLKIENLKEKIEVWNTMGQKEFQKYYPR